MRPRLNHPHAAVCCDAALHILSSAVQGDLHRCRRRCNAQQRHLQARCCTRRYTAGYSPGGLLNLRHAVLHGEGPPSILKRVLSCTATSQPAVRPPSAQPCPCPSTRPCCSRAGPAARGWPWWRSGMWDEHSAFQQHCHPLEGGIREEGVCGRVQRRHLKGPRRHRVEQPRARVPAPPAHPAWEPVRRADCAAPLCLGPPQSRLSTAVPRRCRAAEAVPRGGVLLWRRKACGATDYRGAEHPATDVNRPCAST